MTTVTPRAMTAQDITRIRFISDPRISPDGRQVAFVVTVLSESEDEYRSSIWLVDSSGGEPRRFTGGPKRDSSPRWSPDGTRLAFISEREAKKKPQLYVMPAAGGEPERLTDLKRGVANPVWSPDGARIAFTVKVGGWDEPDDEQEQSKSKPARVINTMKYKFNGEGFTHDRFSQIFVIAAAGGAPVQITEGEFNHGDIAWSPDSRLIAFSAARHADRDYDNASDIWVVQSEGGAPCAVTDTSGPAGHPSYAPDGRSLAYLGHRYLNQSGRNMLLWVAPLGEHEQPGGSTAAGTPRNLTDALDRTCPSLASDGPIWSADGRWLTFAAEDQGGVPVYRVPADGSAPPAPVIDGERQVTGLSATHDGALLAFTATDAVSPAELFICNADGSGERQLTDLNREWKAEVARSRPERFRFERAGEQVDCWVIKPYGYQPGQRYPALLNVHGGPHTQYGWNFFDEFQVQAGAGYAVIYTNPRGSQGYGERFTRAVLGDWGGGDYADVIAGLDEALRRCDFIDRERLGVLGGSYGGFMTSWAVGHSDRFKAACSERAVNNVYTLFGTSDIGHSFAEAHSGYLPWENMQWYIDHSPLTYAKEIGTPLLIIHSPENGSYTSSAQDAGRQVAHGAAPTGVSVTVKPSACSWRTARRRRCAWTVAGSARGPGSR